MMFEKPFVMYMARKVAMPPAIAAQQIKTIKSTKSMLFTISRTATTAPFLAFWSVYKVTKENKKLTVLIPPISIMNA